MSRLTRLTRSRARRAEHVGGSDADPAPLHRQSRRDRRADPPNLRPARDPRRSCPPTDGPDALDLLDVDAVVAAALAAGADAVHPGLRVPRRERRLRRGASRPPGSRWVGPPPAAIRAMGDKAAARRLAASLGVPVLAGYDDADQSDAALTAAADADRLPGPRQAGGRRRRQGDADRPRAGRPRRRPRRRPSRGHGRLRRRPADPRAARRGRPPRRDPGPVRCRTGTASTSASATARSSGATRRSSRRRRRPASTPALRARLGDGGARARARGRLRERRHLRVPRRRPRRARLPRDEHAPPGRAPGHGARDRPRPRRRPAPDRRRRAARVRAGRRRAPTGHAVEVRLYAEDAEDGFLPATGRDRGAALAGRRRHPGRCRDRRSATEIGGRFDPMLAKIIAWGPTAATALDRLAARARRDASSSASSRTCGSCAGSSASRSSATARPGPTRSTGSGRPTTGPIARAIPDEAWSAAAAALPDRRPTRATRGPAAGGSTAARGRPRSRATATDDRSVAGRAGRRRARGRRRVGDVVHVDVAGRSVAFRLAPPPDVDARPRARSPRARRRGGPAEVVAPMPGAVLAVHVARRRRPSRPATRSSRSRR